MNLTRLEEFLAILEAGSIRGASRKIGASQPKLTKGMRQLERQLGVKLLQRTPTGVLPTPFGRTLAVRARSIRAEIRKVREEIEHLAGINAGSVAFGVGAVTASLLVPTAMRRLRARFPEARIRITEGLPHVLVPMVRDETLDFAIGGRMAGKLDPALRFTHLFTSPRTVVARRGHPLARATSAEDLKDAEWLSLPALTAVAMRPQPKWMSRLRQVIDCESFNAAAALLAQTDMVGLISKRLLDDPFTPQNLVEIRIREPLPSFSVGLYQRADAPLAPAAAAAAEAITYAARKALAGPAA